MKSANSSCAPSGAGSTAISPGKEETGTKKDQWARVTMLGCCREVGRAAFLLSTPDSKVLIDCGEKPDNSNGTPYLYVPEIHPLAQLDAVVLTHAHLDHCALIPLLYKYGYEGPVYSTPRRATSRRCSSSIISMSSIRKTGKFPTLQTRSRPTSATRSRSITAA